LDGRLFEAARRHCRLLEPECYAALAQVVGRHFNIHAVAGQDADAVLAHLAARMGQDDVSLLSSFTRNMAFGSSSVTMPLNSIISSFDTQSSFLCRIGARYRHHAGGISGRYVMG
jgi:hypothetical protein